MGLLLAVVLGAFVGAIARAVAPSQVPQRVDAAIILAAVGGGLGAFAATLAGTWRLSEISTGTITGAAIGAVGILAAVRILPVVAPAFVKRLPGQPSPED